MITSQIKTNLGAIAKTIANHTSMDPSFGMDTYQGDATGARITKTTINFTDDRPQADERRKPWP